MRLRLATALEVANNGSVESEGPAGRQGDEEWLAVAPQKIGCLQGAEVWRFPLEVAAGALNTLRDILSRDELARAERIRPGPRERFVVARGQLRRILAAYLGVPPSRVVIGAGPHGKPFAEAGPRFNLSHSGALGLCAVSRDAEVGVDVETLRPVPEADLIARRWLGPEACADMERAGVDRDAAFLRHWTRREAYLKGLGVGITEAGAPDPADPARWVVLDLEPAPGYVGALAVARSGPRGSSVRSAAGDG